MNCIKKLELLYGRFVFCQLLPLFGGWVGMRVCVGVGEAVTEYADDFTGYVAVFMPTVLFGGFVELHL